MKRLFLWGTGQVAEKLWTQCQTLRQYEILGFIDNDCRKQGGTFKGLPVYSSEILNSCRPDFIVVLTDAYDEVHQQIKSVHPEMEDIIRNKNYFYMESILERYRGTTDLEEIEVLDYIKKNGLDIFNYRFAERYRNLPIDIAFDQENGMFYVLYDGRPLYFSKEFDSEEKAASYFRFILLEQDVRSPHRYITDGYEVEEGDVVVDAGAAEGLFSLQVIDKASKLYIVETDEGWVEALRETFRNYAEKVVILQKFISSYDEGDIVSLDAVIHEPVNYIKMDIEGNEWDALLGAKRIIGQSKSLKSVICCYHSDFDRVLIEDFMDKNGLCHSVGAGLIWYPLTVRQNYVSTRLNKAIVRGIKTGA